MKKFITNAFLSLFLEKDARERVIASQGARKRPASAKRKATPASQMAEQPAGQSAAPSQGAAPPVSSERAELIKNALKVQQAQARNLSPADKRRLQALAKGKFPQPATKKR